MKNGGMKVHVAEEMCCCNSCYARNYDTDGEATGRRVERIWNVCVGQIVIHVCDGCSKQLIGEIVAAQKAE